MTSYIQDADATLDYVWQWSSWLAADETISEATVTADAGLTVAPTGLPTVIADKAVTAWLTGGTPGTKYGVACRITTSAGRTDERTIRVTVQNR